MDREFCKLATWLEGNPMLMCCQEFRSNGQIMATDLYRGNVYLVTPPSQAAAPPIVAHFGNNTAVSGIAELEHDVFYVQGIAGSNLDQFSFPANTSSVWRIDMRRYESTGKAQVNKVADIPKIWLPNGMSALSKRLGTILIADTYNGLIWRLNVRTGIYDVAIDHPIIKSIPGSNPPFGVNGVRIVGNTLYFSSFNQGVIGTFPIDLKTGHATGGPHIISKNAISVDDFAIGKDGSVWFASPILNKVSRVYPNGTIQTISSDQLAGPVAAKFGRTQKDKNKLYISTNGQITSANGTLLQSDGQIVYIDTSKLL